MLDTLSRQCFKFWNVDLYYFDFFVVILQYWILSCDVYMNE